MSGSDDLSNHLLDKYSFPEQAYQDAYKVAITENSVSLMNKLSQKIQDNKIFEQGFVAKSKSNRTKFRNDALNGFYFEHLVDLTNSGKFNARMSLISECLNEATKHQSADFVSELIETFSINDLSENSSLSDKKRFALKEAFEVSLIYNGTSGRRSDITDELTSVMSKDEKLNKIMEEMRVSHIQQKTPSISKEEILDRVRDDLVMRDELAKMLNLQHVNAKREKVQVKEDVKNEVKEHQPNRSNSNKL